MRETKSDRRAITWHALSEYRTELMGAACLLVMLGHFSDSNVTSPHYGGAFFRFASVGNVGVDIFLLVSGIGLFYSYDKSKTGFYIKRFSRVLAPYLIFAVPYYIWRDISGLGSFFRDITTMSFFMTGDRILWYIPAIMIFYLLYPLFYRLFAAKGRLSPVSRLVIFCGGVSAVCALLMAYHPAFYDRIEIFLTRFIIFAVGCCFGKYVREGRPLPQASFFAAAVYFFIYVFHFRRVASVPSFYTRLLYAPLAVSISIIFVWAAGRMPHAVMKAASFVGARSLELYLSHVLIRNVYFHMTDGIADDLHITDYLIIYAAAFAAAIPAHMLASYVQKLIKERTAQREK